MPSAPRTRLPWSVIVPACCLVAVAAVAWSAWLSLGESQRWSAAAVRAERDRLQLATLERDLASLYSVVLEPPWPGGERLAHYARARREAEAGVDFLELMGTRPEALTLSPDLAGDRDAVAQTLTFADAVFQSLPGAADGSPPLSHEQLAGFREKMNTAARGIAKLSLRAAERAAGITAQAQAEQRAHRWHTRGLILLAATLLGGAGLALHRAALRQRAEAREMAALGERFIAAEATQRTMFLQAHEGFFLATPEGRFTHANPALTRMYGYESEAAFLSGIGDVASQLQVEESQGDALLESLLEADAVSSFELEVLRDDGRTVWIREQVRAVRDPAGCVLHLQGTVEDVSDRWWGEQRRRLQFATTRMLEKAASVAEARPMILKTVCEILEWDMGAVWDVDDAAGVLRCVEVWHTPEIDITEYEQAVGETELPPGSGLAGEVWLASEPRWQANLAADAHGRGAQVAARHGMGSAYGVPIKVGGEVRHVAEFFSPKVAPPDPELLQTLGVIANQLGHLIEQKTAEQALRSSEARKSAILQSALDGIISFDVDGRILEFNPAAERLFALSQEEAQGRNLSDLIVWEGLLPAHRFGFVLFNAGSTNGAFKGYGRRVELTGKRTDGVEVPMEAAISRLTANGEPLFTAFIRDISERKEAGRVTSELAAVVTNSNDAVLVCTLDGVVRSWNTGAERIYGYTAWEILGQSLEVLIPPDRLDEFPRALHAVGRGESLPNYETVRLRKDGRKISVAITESPIRGEGGAITGLSAIVRDITERKRLEEDLLQSQKMDAIGRLAGGIAHDFNNILTAILGYSDLLIGQIEERHWMYKHLAEIRKAADFASSLTHQLLAFSRRQPLYLRVFCINDTVRQMQRMLQRVIGEHITIQTSLEAESGRMKADPSQLEQVLLNLCVNARDAMPGGGTIHIATEDLFYYPESELAVNDMPAGEYVKLSVEDRGTGMPPEIIKHIFEPFFTTKEKGQGTGLGLATCYGIVRQSGGYIAVDTEVGRGTTFAIYLPRVDALGEKTATRKEVGQLPGGTETILYVEDEISVRSLTAHVLRKLGYTVLEAADGREARVVVEAQNGHGIDLLFSDVVLPDLGGRDLAKWVCQRNTATKLLFTSGYADEAVLRRYGLETWDPFLCKPFSPSDLALKVREVMDGTAEGEKC